MENIEGYTIKREDLSSTLRKEKLSASYRAKET
jgi:hypothetical protein